MRKQESIDYVVELNKDYDFSEYDFTKGYDERSTVICPKHGKHERRFRELRQGKPCPECIKENYVNPQRETTESYINKLNKKFPNHILDLTNFEYPKMQHSEVIFKCKEHGEFISTPNRALYAKINPCFKCSLEQRGVSAVGDLDSFIRKAKEKYGDKYSYERVNFRILADNVEVYCKVHKDYFTINANNFIYSAKIGCPKCILDNIKKTQRVPQEEFIKRCIEVQGEDKFSLDKVVYDGGAKKIEVICNTCGITFFPIADNFSKGSGCPHCANVRKFNKWKDEPTRLYVIKLFNGLYKLGVTINTVRRRYHRDLETEKYEVLYDEVFEEGRTPFRIEQKVRSLIWEYNYKGESPFRRTGTNEIFTVNPIKYIEEVKKELKEKHEQPV